MGAEIAGARGHAGSGRTGRVRLAGVIPRGELQFPVALVNTAFSMLLQLSLYYFLWHALYPGADQTAARNQITSFSLLAVLLSRVRWGFSASRRDTVAGRIRDGSIVYWYTRPLAPRRFLFWLYLGESVYRWCWMVPGLLVCTALGAVTVPDGPGRFGVAVLSIALGQVILYYLAALLDLACFWTTSNTGVQRLYQFAQELLSGAAVPLWLLPGWIGASAGVLPFAAAVNTPLSLYVGRTSTTSVPVVLLIQCFWVVVLAASTRLLWNAANRRVAIQGG